MDTPFTLETLLREERVFRPLPQAVIEANVNPQELAAARAMAEDDPFRFWEEAALSLEWYRHWDAVVDDPASMHPRWFPGARLNIVHNCLDRHVGSAAKNRLAIIWESETGDVRKLTYYELYREVNRFAGALRALGVGKGDRVAVVMPNLPETVVAMLAAAKIGAVHAVIFSGFSAKATAARIDDLAAKVVVTADGYYRNGRIMGLKSMVDEALLKVRPGVAETVVVVRRLGLDVEMNEPRDLHYEDLVRGERGDAHTEVMEADDDLFILHTSGTGGTPKGIVHSHGGYMVGVDRTCDWVFDLKPTDIYHCTADPGWITGHSYGIYGPLLRGATILQYEGHLLYPQADRLWSMVAKHGVTVLYTMPTLARMLARFGQHYLERHDLSTLRLLGSVGEPISPETWVWLHKKVGRGECPVLDTWWQTETGMCLITPMPVSLLKPGSVGKPFPGLCAAVVDRSGQPVGPGKGGLLVIGKPWPAMAKGMLGDPRGFEKSYLSTVPGTYFTGDVARVDADGYFWIQGRADDVLNVAGHRIGSAELEAALCSHKAVSEACVIGLPDAIKGEVPKGFVVLRADAAAQLASGALQAGDLVRQLTSHVRGEVGPFAEVKNIEFRDNLPKTPSGKLMRRKLRARELGLAEGEAGFLAEDDAAAAASSPA